MSFIGNVIWFVFGGFIMGMGWLVAGLLWCITIIGVPVGVQCMKCAVLAFSPFGRKIVSNEKMGSFLLNLIWICVSGIELAVAHAVFGLILCITIVGIPFGRQHFKLARMALAPWGTSAV